MHDWRFTRDERGDATQSEIDATTRNIIWNTLSAAAKIGALVRGKKEERFCGIAGLIPQEFKQSAKVKV